MVTRAALLCAATVCLLLVHPIHAGSKKGKQGAKKLKLKPLSAARRWFDTIRASVDCGILGDCSGPGDAQLPQQDIAREGGAARSHSASLLHAGGCPAHKWAQDVQYASRSLFRRETDGFHHSRSRRGHDDDEAEGDASPHLWQMLDPQLLSGVLEADRRCWQDKEEQRADAVTAAERAAAAAEAAKAAQATAEGLTQAAEAAVVAAEERAMAGIAVALRGQREAEEKLLAVEEERDGRKGEVERGQQEMEALRAQVRGEWERRMGEGRAAQLEREQLQQTLKSIQQQFHEAAQEAARLQAARVQDVTRAATVAAADTAGTEGTPLPPAATHEDTGSGQKMAVAAAALSAAEERAVEAQERAGAAEGALAEGEKRNEQLQARVEALLEALSAMKRGAPALQGELRPAAGGGEAAANNSTATGATGAEQHHSSPLPQSQQAEEGRDHSNGHGGSHGNHDGRPPLGPVPPLLFLLFFGTILVHVLADELGFTVRGSKGGGGRGVPWQAGCRWRKGLHLERSTGDGNGGTGNDRQRGRAGESERIRYRDPWRRSESCRPLSRHDAAATAAAHVGPHSTRASGVTQGHFDGSLASHQAPTSAQGTLVPQQADRGATGSSFLHRSRALAALHAWRDITAASHTAHRSSCPACRCTAQPVLPAATAVPAAERQAEQGSGQGTAEAKPSTMLRSTRQRRWARSTTTGTSRCCCSRRPRARAGEGHEWNDLEQLLAELELESHGSDRDGGGSSDRLTGRKPPPAPVDSAEVQPTPSSPTEPGLPLAVSDLLGRIRTHLQGGSGTINPRGR